jgi:hypothetical protein
MGEWWYAEGESKRLSSSQFDKRNRYNSTSSQGALVSKTPPPQPLVQVLNDNDEVVGAQRSLPPVEVFAINTMDDVDAAVEWLRKSPSTRTLVIPSGFYLSGTTSGADLMTMVVNMLKDVKRVTALVRAVMLTDTHNGLLVPTEAIRAPGNATWDDPDDGSAEEEDIEWRLDEGYYDEWVG